MERADVIREAVGNENVGFRIGDPWPKAALGGTGRGRASPHSFVNVANATCVMRPLPRVEEELI